MDLKSVSYVFMLLSISMLGMSGMNISPALQNISETFPEISEETIQSLVTLPSLFIVFSSFLAEPLSRLISKKRTILLGSVIFIAAGMFPFFTSSFEILRLSRMLIGVGIGIMSPLSTTLLFTRFTDEDQRNTVIGWQSCASAMGSVLATTLAGIFVMIGYRYTFLVHLLGVMTLLAVAIFLPQDRTERVTREKKEERQNIFVVIWRTIRAQSVLLLAWYLIMFCFMGFINSFSTKISLLVESSGIGTVAVSTLGISLLTVGSFFGGLFYGAISKRLSKLTIGVGMLFAGLGLFLMSAAKQPLLVYLSSVFTGLGLALVTPGILVGVVGAASEKNRTLAIAVNTAMSNLGLSLSPYLTAFTTVLFFGQSKTIRDEYFISAAVLSLMGVIAVVIALAVRTGRSPLLKAETESKNSGGDDCGSESLGPGGD